MGRFLLFFVVFLLSSTTSFFADDWDDALEDVVQSNYFSQINLDESPDYNPERVNTNWDQALENILGDDLFDGINYNDSQGMVNIRTDQADYSSSNSAYIHQSCINVIEREWVVVKIEGTNVRLGPSREFGVIIVGQVDQKFRYVSRIGEWVEISLDIEDSGQNIQTINRWGTVNVDTRLNFRSSPWGAVIGKFVNGDKVEILEKDGDWYKVRSGNQIGYVSAEYVDAAEVISPAPVIAPDPWETVIDSNSVEGTQSGRVVFRDGGVEIEGVMLQGQHGADPYDTEDGKGEKPSGYCGPTSMQNVLAFYGVQKSRDYLALTHLDGQPHSMYQEGVGSYFHPMIAMAKHVGFANSEIVWNDTLDGIRERVKQGRPQIISVKGRITDTDGKGYYTSGHIMTVVGIKDNGNVIVHDSVGGTTGTRREIPNSCFMSIWRDFTVDIKR
jgi:uncharacterized protein YgiM (DUF1202 family)